MLPEKLYEVLPYVYVAAGISMMLGVKSWLALIAGVLISLAGAVIWVLRSDNRRSDIKKARDKYGGVMPFWLYELLPFSYFTFALVLFVVSSNMYLYPFATVMLVIGIHLWILRTSYRKHQRPEPVKKFNPLRSRTRS